MTEPRNPYATTSVPLETPGGAQYANGAGATELEYSTFWRRVGALLLDGLILLPLSLAVYIGLIYTRFVYLYWIFPGLAITAWYAIYLVIRNGGTPGKRILDLKIVKRDGSPVTTKAAILRYSVHFMLGALAMLGMAVAAFNITDADFQSLSYFEKLSTLSTHAPAWNTAVTWCSMAWYLLAAIVMLCNAQRRAVHDFIAGTVVIRTS